MYADIHISMAGIKFSLISHNILFKNATLKSEVFDLSILFASGLHLLLPEIHDSREYEVNIVLMHETWGQVIPRIVSKSNQSIRKRE